MGDLWLVVIVLCLALGLYNLYISAKIIKSVAWILKHVMIVKKGQTKDQEFEAIKDAFGIYDPPSANEEVVDLLDDIDDEQ